MENKGTGGDEKKTRGKDHHPSSSSGANKLKRAEVEQESKGPNATTLAVEQTATEVEQTATEVEQKLSDAEEEDDLDENYTEMHELCVREPPSESEDSDAELDNPKRILLNKMEPRKPLPKPRDFVPQIFSDDYTWEAPIRIRRPRPLKMELFDAVNSRFEFLAEMRDHPFIPGYPWFFVDAPTMRIFSRSPRYVFKTYPNRRIPDCCAIVKAKLRFSSDPQPASLNSDVASHSNHSKAVEKSTPEDSSTNEAYKLQTALSFTATVDADETSSISGVLVDQGQSQHNRTGEPHELLAQTASPSGRLSPNTKFTLPPLPEPTIPYQRHPQPQSTRGTKDAPPKPEIEVMEKNERIVLTWTHILDIANNAEMESYQLFVCEETLNPNHIEIRPVWRNLGTIQALPLPMGCNLVQFSEGTRYHFIVRGVDVYNRSGPFSEIMSFVSGRR